MFAGDLAVRWRQDAVPPPEIRRLQDVTRYRVDLVGARTAEKQRAGHLAQRARLLGGVRAE